MVTITLQDRDALAVLAVLTVAKRYLSTEDTSASIDRALPVFRCALLMCDCCEPEVTA